ncbi:hypothetical protein V494_02132, partial [Pseudogymnoascus sp. VKM F-4513 (FW-928)]
MHGPQLRIILGLPLQVHLPKHIQRALLPLRPLPLPLLLQRSHNPPPALAALEPVRLAIVARGDDLRLARPDQRHEGEQLRAHAYHGARGGVGAAGVHDRDAAVVGGEGEGVAAGRECSGVYPAGGVIQELPADGVEGEALTPWSWLRALIHALDEGGEDAGMGVGGARGEEHGVGVPGDGGDGAADGLLDVLGYPPVVLLFEVADGDDAGAGADGELGFGGRPAHEGRGAVDA